MSDNTTRSLPDTGVYHLPAPRLAGLLALAERARFSVLSTEIAERATGDDVLNQLGSTLKFPIWYGANFDALFDCLTDPGWQPAKGHLLLLTGMSRLRAASPDDFATLIDVFLAVAEARTGKEGPFWIVIDTPARGVPVFPEA